MLSELIFGVILHPMVLVIVGAICLYFKVKGKYVGHNRERVAYMLFGAAAYRWIQMIWFDLIQDMLI